jgi:hypothetical protein
MTSIDKAFSALPIKYIYYDNLITPRTYIFDSKEHYVFVEIDPDKQQSITGEHYRMINLVYRLKRRIIFIRYDPSSNKIEHLTSTIKQWLMKSLPDKGKYFTIHIGYPRDPSDSIYVDPEAIRICD